MKEELRIKNEALRLKKKADDVVLAILPKARQEARANVNLDVAGLLRAWARKGPRESGPHLPCRLCGRRVDSLRLRPDMTSNTYRCYPRCSEVK